MYSILVLVLGTTDGFLSFFPASLPQPFHRRSHSNFLLGQTHDFRFLSSTSALASHYSVSISSFPLYPASPHSGFTSARFSSRLHDFPLLSSLISYALLPGSCTQLPVCFLSSFPVSLPQLFHRCLPYAIAIGLFPSPPLSFVRFSFRF